MTDLVREAEQPKIVFQRDRAKELFKPKMCQKFGLCVCGADGGQGKLAYKLQKKVGAELKRLCWSRRKQKSRLRILLEDARIVVMLHAALPEINAEDGSQPPVRDDTKPETLFYHIGFVNFTTWDMSVHRLHGDDSAEAQAELAERRCRHADEICLQSPALDAGLDTSERSRVCFLKFYAAALQDIDFEVAYNMALFRMCDSSDDDLSAGRMRPGYLRVFPLSGTEEDGEPFGLNVWLGRSLEVPPVRRRQPRPAAAAAVARAPAARPGQSRKRRRRETSASDADAAALESLESLEDVADVLPEADHDSDLASLYLGCFQALLGRESGVVKV